MTALLLPPSAPALRRLVQQGLHWWLTELAGLVPAPVRALVTSRRANDLVLEFGRDEARLVAGKHEKGGPTIIPLNVANQSSTARISERFPGAAVAIALDEKLIFRPEIELPAMAEPNLAQVLRHQIERLVPLDPSSVSFTWQVTERLPGRNAIKVTLAIVKNAVVLRAREFAAEFGLRPTAVMISQADGSPATVWRAQSADAGGGRMRMLCRLMEAAAIICWVSGYGIYVKRLDHRLVALHGQVVTLQAQSVSVQDMARDAHAVQTKLLAMNARLATPTPLAILDSLTKALPLDTSVSEFSWDGKKIDIIGMATHASALLAHIERAPLFTEPSFTAPITAAPGSGGERFEIEFRIRAASVR